MGWKYHARKLLLAAACTLPAPGGWAFDWVTVNPLNLELLLGYRDSRHSEVLNDNRDTEWETGLRIEQEGYVEDPRLLSFRYVLEPKYYDGQYSAARAQGDFSEDTSNKNLGYSLGIEVLRESTLPVKGRFDAASWSSVLTGSLGRRTESDYSWYSALLEWKYDPFPMSFEAQRRDTSLVSTRSSGTPFLRDDVEHTIRISGQSSKTRMRLEARSLDDRVPSRNNDFDIYQASFDHHLPWGRASFLDSGADYFNRTGRNGYERLQLREFASIRHTDSLHSEINYGFGLTRQTVDTTRNVGTYKLAHQLYRNLRTGAAMGLEKHTSGRSELDRRMAGLDLQYQKSNLFGASVGLYLGANFSNNATGARVALLEVVDESYTAPVTGLIILENRFILAPTIIVTDTTGTITYAEDQDYVVEAIGDGLTQLTIIPGGLIEAGDVILVSYKAAALPPREYDRLATTATLNVGFRGFSLTHNDAKLTYTIIAGNPGSLADTRNTTTRAAYAFSLRRASIQLAVERRYYRNGEFESTTRLANQSVGLSLSAQTRINVNFNQAFTETQAENVDLYSAHLDLTWRPRYNLSIRPRLGAWKRTSERVTNGQDTEISETDDTVWSASLTVNWTFRKLSFDLTYSHNDRTLEQYPVSVRESTDDNIRIYLRRRF